MRWRGKGNNKVPVIKPEDDRLGRMEMQEGMGKHYRRLQCFMACAAFLSLSLFFKGKQIKGLGF